MTASGEFLCIAMAEIVNPRLDLDTGVYRLGLSLAAASSFREYPPDVFLVKKRLPLQVVHLDVVPIDDDQASDTSTNQQDLHWLSPTHRSRSAPPYRLGVFAARFPQWGKENLTGIC